MAVTTHNVGSTYLHKRDMCTGGEFYGDGWHNENNASVEFEESVAALLRKISIRCRYSGDMLGSF